LEKKISTQLSQEAWVGVKINSEAAGFSRAVGRVVIEQDADQQANRIGSVEFLQRTRGCGGAK
jgi:hypothetical protein